MNKNDFDIGMVGLGVMGKNLLLNITDKGFSGIGLDKDTQKVSSFTKEAGSVNLQGTSSPSEFMDSLTSPSKVMMLVPAGTVVDAVIDELLPYLEKGDLLMDGGNSYFEDTDRRIQRLAKMGIHYMGVGISGGEEGARYGPSIMPGGTPESYEMVAPIFEAIAAKVKGEPCVTYIGNRSAGNYVKMVHNGIEYALMQLIAESYHLMKAGFGLSDAELKDVFDQWSKGELNSFLMEITANIFAKMDAGGSELLLNHILDSARQKGTGKWTSQNAMDLQVPAPSIDMAVMVRDMSAHKEERVAANAMYQKESVKGDIDSKQAVEKLQHALYFCFVTVFAQGFSMIKTASESYGYEIELEEIAKIWRGGCIIRAAMLEDFRKAFKDNPELTNIMVNTEIAGKLSEYQGDARECIKMSMDTQIPMAAFMASITYFDLYKSSYLPVNLIQAQRDYFGAHTYERTDKDGSFHTDWRK